MTIRIACYTLYDITATGVLNRAVPPVDADAAAWTHCRNTQCNYDTLLQIISLRSQPEDCSPPRRVALTREGMKLWGNQHRWSKTGCYWTFEFTVAHGSVFNNGVSELGALWGDSHGVPMILVGGELPTLRATLDTGDAHRNIHWTIINHDHT